MDSPPWSVPALPESPIRADHAAGGRESRAVSQRRAGVVVVRGCWCWSLGSYAKRRQLRRLQRQQLRSGTRRRRATLLPLGSPRRRQSRDLPGFHRDLGTGPAASFSAVAAAVGKGQTIVNAAASQAGVPYCFGGGNWFGPGPGGGCRGANGFDCTGLTMYAVYQAIGIRLGRYDQMSRGTPLSPRRIYNPAISCSSGRRTTALRTRTPRSILRRQRRRGWCSCLGYPRPAQVAATGCPELCSVTLMLPPAACGKLHHTPIAGSELTAHG